MPLLLFLLILCATPAGAPPVQRPVLGSHRYDIGTEVEPFCFIFILSRLSVDSPIWRDITLIAIVTWFDDAHYLHYAIFAADSRAMPCHITAIITLSAAPHADAIPSLLLLTSILRHYFAHRRQRAARMKMLLLWYYYHIISALLILFASLPYYLLLLLLYAYYYSFCHIIYHRHQTPRWRVAIKYAICL